MLEEHFGARPRLECQVGASSSATPGLLQDEPRREASPRIADPNPATESVTSEERTTKRANDPAGVPDQPDAALRRDAPMNAGAPDAARPDDTIGSEDEVFEMARQRLAPRDGGG